MPDPSVSAVIPSYNRFSFLVQAVESVFRQSFESWELVVVDDGSTDETRDFLNSMRDPRVRSVRQENAGVSSARNRGVAESRAPLVAFLDSDDLWMPGKLAAQVEFFSLNSGAAICQTEEIWERRGRRVNPGLKHAKKSGRIFRDCLPLCIVSPSAVMMRRSAFDKLGGFDESLPACEDYDLWLRAALRFEIHTLPEPLIVKRGGHADQLSKGWGLDRFRIAALEKALADPLLSPADAPLVLEEIKRRARILAEGAGKRGNWEMAALYGAKALNPGRVP